MVIHLEMSHHFSCLFIYVVESEHIKRWVKKAVLSESIRSPVQDIKFAPKHVGFKLATGTKDGIVRIYECLDITNLTHWNVAVLFLFVRKLEFFLDVYVFLGYILSFGCCEFT